VQHLYSPDTIAAAELNQHPQNTPCTAVKAALQQESLANANVKRATAVRI